MPKGKSNVKERGTYAVTNTGKRTQVVGSNRFPGKSKEGKPQTVVVDLSPREHLQVRNRVGLEVKAHKAQQARPPADG